MRKFFFFTSIFILSGLLTFSYVHFRPMEEKEYAAVTKSVYADRTENGPEEFLIVDQDGFLVVYQISSGCIYENTKIKTGLLPADIRKKIQKGYRISGCRELYSFLENCSS